MYGCLAAKAQYNTLYLAATAQYNTLYLFGLDFALRRVYIAKRLVHHKKFFKLQLRAFKHAFLCCTTVAVV
jgi:hypothetical protein